MNEIFNTPANIPANTPVDILNLNDMDMLIKYCEIMAKAPAYAAMGGMPGIFALVMTAKELGIGPMTALNGGMYLIPPGVDKEGKPKGQPTVMMAAKTMSMMIWKAKHKIEVIECTNTVVTLKGTRADNGVSMTVTMTMDKAKQAGLTHDLYGKPKIWSTWFKNSEDMLWKTCVAKLGRRLFTDVIGNCYEPAEFEQKESKENVAKVEKKELVGKNVPKIEKISFEPIEPKESIEDFKISLGLDGRDIDIMDYVKGVAAKRGLEIDDMIYQCYENKESFLKTYDFYKAKQGIKLSNEN